LRQGQKYLRTFWKILEPLADIPAHGNRICHYRQWVCLVLLHFYNPLLNSLRSLAAATDFEPIQEIAGVKHASLGAMSESAAS